MSWVAANNDFLSANGAVNPLGPNSLVHKHYYEGYDSHVLLTSASAIDKDAPFQRLSNFLRSEYGHVVDEVAMNIPSEDVINALAISKAINTLLLRKYKNDEIDVFISPGTPAMQVAWYLACMSLGLNMRLFQTVAPGKSKSVDSGLKWVTPEQIGYMSALMFREQHFSEPINPSDKALPEILMPIYQRASRIALTDVNVLITGDTGTGKELLARHIHEQSHRKGKKFIAVNCAAFAGDLLESRLFGYKKGAFTGALTETNGLFKEADGGTIFLDEIGDISSYMQQTLLRVLGENEIMKVGSTKVEKINVRVIAATNKDIYDMSVKDQYRADLYYRLCTTELRLPSIQEYSLKNKEMIFSYLWKKAQLNLRIKGTLKIPSGIKKTLMEYTYPGNIREMENLIYGLWAESEQVVSKQSLPPRMNNPPITSSLKLEDVITHHIKKVYMMCHNNTIRASELLDKSPTTVRKYLNILE